jgi:hypothetical protein
MLAGMSAETSEAPQPPILNAEYDFVRLAPAEIRNRFVGMPAKVLLSEGETLYRFLPGGLEAPFEFWLPLDTFHQLRAAPGIPDWAVWRNANSRAAATRFCKATLLKKVYGFRGCVPAAGAQAVTLASMLAGSMIWIPALRHEDFLVRVYSLGGAEANLPSDRAVRSPF